MLPGSVTSAAPMWLKLTDIYLKGRK